MPAIAANRIFSILFTFKESNDVRFIALRCIVFELSACENSEEFQAEIGCKTNHLTRY